MSLKALKLFWISWSIFCNFVMNIRVCKISVSINKYHHWIVITPSVVDVKFWWRHWCRHKHLWRVLVMVQISHVTLQHQWKMQLHLSLAVYCSVTWPRPQHIKSQPSTPIDVSLHSRPFVFSQKLGELS